MARYFVKRDGTLKITGGSKWPSDDHPEEIDDQDAEWIAYLDETQNPPDTRPAKGNSQAGGIPGLQDDINAIWQVLDDLKLVKP